MTAREAWRLRRLTLEAMLRVCAARVLVRFVPLGYWRGRLGRAAPAHAAEHAVAASPEHIAEARRLALHVERAAARLPFSTKCLPRAIALARMLQARGRPYSLRIAIRPPAERGGTDDLHAWVEMGGIKVIGDLPGNWVILLNLLN